MGKQINYYMEREAFLKIAEMAVKEGCAILKNEHLPQPQPQTISSELSVIDESTTRYYFYLPELAPLKHEKDKYGNYYISRGYDELSLALIEASYSQKTDTKDKTKKIGSARLYIPTGYYNAEGVWIPRSERLTKVYEKLARAVKKIAPYTEVEFTYLGRQSNGDEELCKAKRKIYASPQCLEWRLQGYEFSEFIVDRRGNEDLFCTVVLYGIKK